MTNVVTGQVEGGFVFPNAAQRDVYMRSSVLKCGTATHSSFVPRSFYKGDLDLIFANPDGTLLKPDSISSSVSLLFRRLKIKKPKGVALRLFRHPHGSHLLAAGMELPAISERLGHSSVIVTATVYSHRLTGRDKEG